MSNFSKKLKVIVADDHSIFRLGLINILNQIPGIKQIDQAADGVEVLNLLGQDSYDVIFLDIEMPVLNGIETIQKVKANYPDVKVITLSMFSNENYIMEMYERNTNGYLLKNTNLKQLKRALEHVMDDQEYFCPEAAEVLFKRLVAKDKDKEDNTKEVEIDLSERETEILLLICEQYSSVEIAEKLFIADNTVKRHRQKLIEKTGSKNLAGLVLFAIKHGIIQIPS